MPNRLATESSPYLRQHADNPVDWYPWGSEAFARAKSEDKPVLLSVGYAACHWCHVMAHESFEDATTAALMNELFVNIKVDREERPDVDSIYMQAVQAMTGHGGWPMTVALTPDGEPFWGGTYFPPVDSRGMPSFRRVLQTLSDAWTTKRATVDRTAASMREQYAEVNAAAVATGALSPEILERAFATLAKQHDPILGGFGGAPKFPQAMSLDFCLRWFARSGNTMARDIAHQSFIAMARGGIYDQVGGGFHRYSVDAEWLVPHFEKMLYDNALLTRLGAHLWQVTRDDEVARIVSETINWLSREMTSPNGAFYASLDADSEGHEGVFYIWAAAELDALLGDDAPIAKAVWKVTIGGNFEGKNILHVPSELAMVAKRLNISEGDVRAAIDRSVRILYDVRSKREWPGRDDKILAGWNGLMTRALAEAARIFDRNDWLQSAIRAGEFLAHTMTRDGRVMRVHMDGVTKVPGFLEDHAAVALAFIALHESTGSAHWLHAARSIASEMHAHFRDAETGAWYDTADDAEALITRPRDLFDNAVPAGPSLAVELMLRLSEIDGNSGRATEVVSQLAAQLEPMARWPQGFGHLLGVADLALFGAVAVVIVGDRKLAEYREFARVVADRYLPTLTLVSGPADGRAVAELLRDRDTLGGVPTAYVCRNFICDRPTNDPVELGRQLDHVRNAAKLG
ncbi:MAG: thioredoxin domain-containing protein [Gemmatimonadaceae bacterium]